MTRTGKLTALGFALLALVATGCGDDTKGKTAVRGENGIVVTPLRGSVIDVPKRPIAIATGEGGVWVTSMAGGVLTNIDPKTNNKVGKPTITDDAPYAVDVAFGKVWVA